MGILRFLLASLVAFAHSGVPLWGYYPISPVVPVQLFFIISGFYMSLVLDRKYRGMKNYTLFVSNRFLRLFPAYWFVLLAVVIISVIGGVFWGDWGRLTIFRDLSTHFNSDLRLLTFSNFTLLGQDLALFGGFNPATGGIHFVSDYNLSNPPLYRYLLIPQAWSLSVELLFYLVAPFLVNRRWPVIAAITLASLGLRAYIYFGLHWANDPWLYRFFPTELALFMFGVFAYRIYQRIEFLEIPKPILVAPGLIVFAVVLFYSLVPTTSFMLFNLVIWSLYLFAMVAIPFLFKWTKDSRFDAAFGELSYPIYIVQFVVIDFLVKILKDTPSYEYLPVWVVGGCAVLAILINKLVSDPVEKIRKARAVR